MSELMPCGDGNFVVEKVLTADLCESILNGIEDDKKIVIDTEDAFFTTYPVPNDAIPEITKVVIELYHKYVESGFRLPTPTSIEISNVKVYEEGGFMGLHADAVNRETCHRFLGFLFYLNEGYEGGETSYPEYQIRGEIGDCLIFLPFWNMQHEALDVIKGKKAVMTCYLTF